MDSMDEKEMVALIHLIAWFSYDAVMNAVDVNRLIWMESQIWLQLPSLLPYTDWQWIVNWTIERREEKMLPSEISNNTKCNWVNEFKKKRSEYGERWCYCWYVHCTFSFLLILFMQTHSHTAYIISTLLTDRKTHFLKGIHLVARIFYCVDEIALLVGNL